MKKIIQSSAVAVLVSLGFVSHAFAFTQITSQLDLGQRGTNVSSLQEFMAANPSVYPEGLVTGYFGGLTKTAVIRFQAQNNLDQVGRVGPVTVAKINSMIASGGWVMADVSGPAFYNVSMSKNSTSSTFVFNTSEMTSARVVYNTSPLMFNEGDITSYGFGPLGGYSSNSISTSNMSHSVTLNNLQPGTDYYYTIIATDAVGNVSVVGPNAKFRTE